MNKKDKTLEKVKGLISKNNADSNKIAKRIAMKNNIKLGILRREFCQKCYASLKKSTKRIKEGYINIQCNCGQKYRFKIKTS